MRHLVAVAGYVLHTDQDVSSAVDTLTRVARRICQDRTVHRGQVITTHQQVLFGGRCGIAMVFEGTATAGETPNALAVDATTAAVGVGEIWAGDPHAVGESHAASVGETIRRNRDTPGNARGIYAAALYDDTARTLRLYSDRLGLQPLYYYRDAGVLLFSSTIQSLLEYPRIPRRIAEDVLAQLLYLGFLLGDDTYVPGVQRVPSGSVVTSSGSGVTVQRYWSFQYREDTAKTRSIDDYSEECYALLRRAGRRMTPDISTTGVLLSGGLDSRVTLGALVHEFNVPAVTCTYGLTQTTDIQTARQVAGALSCPHHVLSLKSDDLVVDLLNSLVGSDFLLESRNAQGPEVMRLTRPLARHWFSGYLLDATFGGYWLPDAADSTETVAELLLACGPQEERFRAVTGPGIAELARQTVIDAAERSCTTFADTSAENAFERFMIAFRHRGFHIASHAHARPGERNFLMCDYDLFDFFLTLPAEMRRGKKLYIHMLRTKWPELAHIFYGNTGALVGEAPSDKHLARKERSRSVRRIARKLGLGRLLGPSPYLSADKAYTFGEHRDMKRLVESVLLSERALARTHVDADGVKQLVASLRGSASGIRLLFRLLRVELLIRCSVERDRGVFAEWGAEWHGDRTPTVGSAQPAH